jgi:hypothetical protein
MFVLSIITFYVGLIFILSLKRIHAMLTIVIKARSTGVFSLREIRSRFIIVSFITFDMKIIHIVFILIYRVSLL